MFKKIFYFIAKQYESKRKWEKAIRWYRIAYSQDSAISNYRLGFCYEKRKDYGNAIYFFQKALRLETKKSHWYSHIANAYIGLKKEGLAAKYLKDGLHLDPKNKKYLKRYEKIRKKFQEGIPSIDTFLSEISDIDMANFNVTIEGHIYKKFNIDNLKLQINTRKNSLDKNTYITSFSPNEVTVDSYGIYKASFIIPHKSLMVNSMSISHIFDFNIIADETYRVQYYTNGYTLFHIKNYDFTTYTTSNKNFALLSTRKASYDTKSHKEHIVFILGRIHSQTGVAQTVINLANALADIQYKVSLVALDFPGAPNVFPISKKVNFSYVSLSMARKEKQVFNFNSHKQIPKTFRNQLHSYFSNLSCDIVYAPVFGPQFLETIMSALPDKTIKILGDHTGRRYSIYHSLLQKNEHITLSKLIKLAKDTHFYNNINKMNAIHVINPLAKEVFEKINTKHILAIPNMVPKSKNTSQPLFKRDKNIVLIGRLDKGKNFHTALICYKKLLSKYPEWNIEIYGKGAEEKQLTKTIQSLKLNPKKILKEFSSDINMVLSHSSIHLNLSHHESFGLTMVESMNNGCITLSTRKTIGAVYLIDDTKNGYLANDNTESDIYDLLDKTMLMFENKNKNLLSIQKNGYQKSQQFHTKNIVTQWQKSIDELIRRNKLRSIGKAVPEEDIFITDIQEKDNDLIFEVTGNIVSKDEKDLIKLEVSSRKHPLETRKYIFSVKPSQIKINNKNIFKASFAISLDTFLLKNSTENLSKAVVSRIWDFSIISKRKTRVMYFHNTNLLFNNSSYDLIPYNTSHNMFSLLTIRKSSYKKTKTRLKYSLVLPRIDTNTVAAQSIINLANMLSSMDYDVTLIALDIVGISNKIPISNQVSVEYISCSLHRDKKESFNFNSSKTILPDDYTSQLKIYFSNLQTDVLYTPIYSAPFLNIILSSLSQNIFVVLGEYSNKRYTIYNRFIEKNTKITIAELNRTTKDKHLFDNIDKMDILHLIKPEVQPLFKNIPHIQTLAQAIDSQKDLKSFIFTLRSLINAKKS